MLDANVSQRHIYFPQTESDSKKRVPKDSAFPCLLWMYRSNSPVRKAESIQVEPKYGKEYNGTWYIHLGNSLLFIRSTEFVYRRKSMQEKLNRYEVYFHSFGMAARTMATEEIQYFLTTHLTDTQYYIYSPNFRIFQTKSIMISWIKCYEA